MPRRKPAAVLHSASDPGRLLRLRDDHDSFLIFLGGPFLMGTLSSFPIPTSWQVSGGGTPPLFNNPGRTGSRDLSIW